MPTVSIATTDGYASELGDTGTFTVTRANQSTALPLIVHYSTSGTAINGIDYATLTGTVTIPIGSTSATITIAPVDTAFSNDQTATVTLLSADDEDTLYDLSGTSSGTVTLHSATSQIAWWKLDETSSTTASDSSGDNLVATVVGSPIWNTYGYLQGGLTLNGSSQYAYASDNVAFDLTTGAAMTISAWVLPGSFGATSVYPILAHGTAYELSLAGGTTSKGVAFTVNGVTVNPSSNQTTLLGNGSWHLITATLSGGAATLYIDGTAVGTATGINLPATDTGTLYLGRDSTNYFNGTLDDVRMYSRALAASEVAALYERACGEHRGNDQRGLGAWRHGDVHGDADRFNRQSVDRVLHGLGERHDQRGKLRLPAGHGDNPGGAIQRRHHGHADRHRDRQPAGRSC